MTNESFTGKVKARRKAPPVHSVLDRTALTQALEDKGITQVTRNHLDAFYQSLHRENYCSLPDFVETYYKNERFEHSGEKDRPSRNKISAKKCRNLMQLPKPFLNYLLTTKEFATLTSKIQQAKTSADRSTTKLIVELWDGQIVEAVLMRYERKGNGRASLCVSSQCGCAMGCTFCATGTMGLSGNLSSGEILEQLVHAELILAKEYELKVDQSKKVDLVRNVVFMGMGEPLDNYANVVEACRAMMDRRRWNLAHGRVTVSTVGLISQMRKLTKDLPEVSLALSLHAPNQEMRTAIVPTATRYPIEKLIAALDHHMMAYLKKRVGEGYTKEERIKESTRRRAMIEYVMLQGDTTSLEAAHQLGKLCENRCLIVNLIPYNATDVKDKLQCPLEADMQKFRDIVASYGSLCTIRRTMGADIASACGQLVQKTEEKEQAAPVAIDIEDVVADKSAKMSREATKASSKASDKGKSREVLVIEDSSSSTKPQKSDSWLESLSTEDLEKWGRAFTIASAVVASCFIASSLVLVRKRR